MKQIHGVRISHQTIINYVNGVSALVKDMIIITDYSIKLNTSKAKNDFDALIKFRKLYSDFLFSFSLSSIECTCGSHNWHMHSSYSRFYDFLGRKIKVSIQRIICAACGKTHDLLIGKHEKICSDRYWIKHRAYGRLCRGRKRHLSRIVFQKVYTGTCRLCSGRRDVAGGDSQALRCADRMPYAVVPV